MLHLNNLLLEQYNRIGDPVSLQLHYRGQREHSIARRLILPERDSVHLHLTTRIGGNKRGERSPNMFQGKFPVINALVEQMIKPKRNAII